MKFIIQSMGLTWFVLLLVNGELFLTLIIIGVYCHMHGKQDPEKSQPMMLLSLCIHNKSHFV